MDYKDFIAEMTLIPSCQKKIKQLEDELNDVWYELTGVKGINYQKEPSTYNSHLAEERKLDLLMRISIYEDMICREKDKLSGFEAHFKAVSSECQELIRLVYFERKKKWKVAQMKGYTISGLMRKIEREAKRI